VHGELLRTILDICSGLQTNRTGAVASTAAATFQQLVVSLFERVTEEDGELPDSLRRTSLTSSIAAGEIPTVATVQGLEGPVQIRPTAHDAHQVSVSSLLLENCALISTRCSLISACILKATKLSSCS
jgi:hypothetical protein